MPAWQMSQRRLFLVMVVLMACASMAALYEQAPNYDGLDLWALPLLSVVLLASQLLLLIWS
ncbi:hypothetical protein [Deinococcus arenicola]|uniref:Uncharacterized protein n=1 Tax=Deinococcus arenicola TaxID=2994950 RepID=A0ABU4DR41_9DEIO|nr:hypothetical protein [Deinococcus sp. ZS9-10]MDV6374906.1 hypothetical protein [Deinococcus sp. ZS9-10]